MIECPFEQMVEDAERDYRWMQRLTVWRRDGDLANDRLVYMYEAATGGYDYSESVVILGTFSKFRARMARRKWYKQLRQEQHHDD